MEEAYQQTQVVKSADRVLDILELLAEEGTPLNLVDITKKLDLPASSGYKILKNLQARGYVESEKSNKTFRLGYKLLEIASRYTHNTSLIVEFNYLAQKIVDDINEAAFLSIRDGNKILYVAEKQSTHPVRFVSHIGMKLPLHTTAMGKAILSTMDPAELNQLYPDRDLGIMTENTISNWDELMKELIPIQNTGLSYSRGEAVQGIWCIGAPILNSKGKAVAATSISIPVERLTEELRKQAEKWILQTAKELSLNIRYKGDTI